MLLRKRHGNPYAPTGALLLVVLFAALPLPRTAFQENPFLALLYWGVLAGTMVFGLSGMHVPGKVSGQSAVRGYAISGAAVSIAMGYVVGVFAGQLKATPYDMTPYGILLNLLRIVPALVGREMIRGYSMGSIWRSMKYRRLTIALLTLFFALTEMSFARWKTATGIEDMVVFVARDAAPALTKACLVSVLVFYGGAAAGILYGGAIDIFQKIFPFLPELPWLAESAIGIGIPAVFALYLSEYCRDTQQDRKPEKQGGSAVYLACLLLSVLFAWFCVGVFRVYPSVVLTGSMEPVIRPGDVVLVRKMVQEEDIYELKEGDIINFEREEINITHRVIRIEEDKAGNRTFFTKGDNNASEDKEQVVPNDIRGVVIRVVPKAGIPVLMMRSQEAIPEGVTDEEEQNNME